jgi:hypothetical protein
MPTRWISATIIESRAMRIRREDIDAARVDLSGVSDERRLPMAPIRAGHIRASGRRIGRELKPRAA